MTTGSDQPQTIPAQYVVEYEQAGTRYGEGFKYFLDVCKMFMLLQAGLGTAVGIILQNNILTRTVNLSCVSAINFPVILISLIGIFSGAGALIVFSRFRAYHNVVSDRAIELERQYGMRLMISVRAVFDAGEHGNSATGIGFLLFLLICGLWIMLAFDSLKDLISCIF